MLTRGGSLVAAESLSKLHQERNSDFISVLKKTLILDSGQQRNIWAQSLEDSGLSMCHGGKEGVASVFILKGLPV